MYDSLEGNQFFIVMTDKKVLFNERRNGLYYHDMKDHDLVFSNTVEQNLEGISWRELSGGSEARRALAMFSYPSQKNSNHMVRTINNCPVTIEYIRNATTIYGCNFSTLKGETVRQQPKRVEA